MTTASHDDRHTAEFREIRILHQRIAEAARHHPARLVEHGSVRPWTDETSSPSVNDDRCSLRNAIEEPVEGAGGHAHAGHR